MTTSGTAPVMGLRRTVPGTMVHSSVAGQFPVVVANRKRSEQADVDAATTGTPAPHRQTGLTSPNTRPPARSARAHPHELVSNALTCTNEKTGGASMLRPNLPNLGPLRHEPRRVRPPFDVADDSTQQKHGETADQWRARIREDRKSALLEALDDVALGDYDHRIIEWLSTWEPGTVATIVSWIYRARHAGQQDAGGAW